MVGRGKGQGLSAKGSQAVKVGQLNRHDPRDPRNPRFRKAVKIILKPIILNTISAVLQNDVFQNDAVVVSPVTFVRLVRGSPRIGVLPFQGARSSDAGVPGRCPSLTTPSALGATLWTAGDARP